jgi:hypothetical protein
VMALPRRMTARDSNISTRGPTLKRRRARETRRLAQFLLRPPVRPG